MLMIVLYFLGYFYRNKQNSYAAVRYSTHSFLDLPELYMKWKYSNYVSHSVNATIITKHNKDDNHNEKIICSSIINI